MLPGSPLYEVSARLVAFDGKSGEIFKKVMSNRRITDLVIHLNTEEQLLAEGIDSEGNHIGFYSFATELISDGKKRAGDPFTFFDTGKHYESYRVSVTTNFLEITSDPNKTDENGNTINLFEKYNNFKVEGLTDENIDVLADFARVFFENDFRARFIR